MRIDSNLNYSIEEYWTLQSGDQPIELSDNDALSKYKEILFDSVGIRLRSDVPIGCMLSGGMDSTSTAVIASEIYGEKISTFSVITGAEKGIYDESEYIDSVVKKINSDHYYIKINPESNELFHVVDEMLSKYDEPICTVTWYALYLVDKLIHENGIKVVLTGMNSDEVNGGYWDHFHYNFYDLIVGGDIKTFNHEYKMWKNNYNRPDSEVEESLAKIDKIRGDNMFEASTFMEYSRAFNKDFVDKYHNVNIPIYDSNSMYIQKMRTDLDRGIHVMTKPEDRNTMAFSIESRSAFYDYRLSEFTYRLPNKFRIRNGVGKWLLRESMKGLLPEKVRTRNEKVGLNAPSDQWFRVTNKNDIYNLINSDAFIKRGIYNVNAVNEIFNSHLSGENHYQFLWQLINTELWFRKFID